MTEREKKLAIFLAIIMVVVVGGGGFWYGFYSPYSEMQGQIALLEGEIEKQENELENFQTKIDLNIQKHPRLKDWKNLSFPLPAKDQVDVEKSHLAALKLDYTNLLMDLLVRNGFKPGSTTVRSVERADLRTVPMLEGKKPAYKPFKFEIVTQAKLEELAGFLQQLHQVPVLHHVPEIKIEKRDKNQSTKGDLKMTINVEGLMVTDATKKPRLEIQKLLAGLKQPPEKEMVLASSKRDYSLLGPVNPFFPPDPPPAPVTPPPPPTVKVRGPSEDPEEVLSGVKLTTITGDGKKWEAYLYDQNRGGRETKIRPSAAWSEFSIKDKYDNEVLKAKLVHIDPAFILFQSGEELYMMRCGETLYPTIANPMDKDNIKSMGLAGCWR